MKKLAMLITLVVVLSVSCVFASELMATTAAPAPEAEEQLTPVSEIPENLATDVKPVTLENIPEEALILETSGDESEAIRIEPSGEVVEPADGVPNDAAEPTTSADENAPATADATDTTAQSSNSTVIGAVIAIVIVIAVIAIVYVLQKK